MNKIVIDPLTGYVGTSSMLLTSYTPNLHPNSVNRAMKRTLSLASCSGPKPDMITVGGKRMFGSSIDTCEFILDNITGQKKGKTCERELWRQTPGHTAFRRALRDHMERVLASSSINGREQQQPSEEQQQPPPEQQSPPPQQQELVQPRPKPQEPDEHVEEVETKASALQKALCAINMSGSVRIDEAGGRVSIIDVINMLCPDMNEDYAG